MAASGATVTVKTALAIDLYAKAGTTVKSKLATFSLKPTKVKQQWYLNGKAISGATATSYKIPAKQATGKLQLKETATFKGSTKTVASNVINIGQLYVVSQPQLEFAQGSTTNLEVKPPVVLPAPKASTISWLRDGVEIKSDGLAIRTIAISDRGTTLSARVNITAPTGYSNLALTTASKSVESTGRVYSLGWSDEFTGANGATANPAYWVGEDGDGVAFGNRGWGNNEQQWYKFENATTDGKGSLNILASRTSAEPKTCYYGGACKWYSSKIVTKGKVGFLYGRMEARIKGAGGNGTWNAFWALGSNIDTKFWPICGELDVTELVGVRPRDVLGYSHGPLSGGPGRGATTQTATNWANDYHVYALDWLPDQITWYVDGVKYATVDRRDNDWVYDHEFYMILNLAMGGNLGGTVDPSLNSATMSVDYVRWSTINGVGTLFQY